MKMNSKAEAILAGAIDIGILYISYRTIKNKYDKLQMKHNEYLSNRLRELEQRCDYIEQVIIQLLVSNKKCRNLVIEHIPTYVHKFPSNEQELIYHHNLMDVLNTLFTYHWNYARKCLNVNTRSYLVDLYVAHGKYVKRTYTQENVSNLLMPYLITDIHNLVHEYMI